MARGTGRENGVLYPKSLPRAPQPSYPHTRQIPCGEMPAASHPLSLDSVSHAPSRGIRSTDQDHTLKGWSPEIEVMGPEQGRWPCTSGVSGRTLFPCYLPSGPLDHQ